MTWAVRVLGDLTPADRRDLLARSNHAIFAADLVASVRGIIEDVRRDGDGAVSRALATFDGCDVPADRLVLRDAEIDDAALQVTTAVKDAIRFAADRMRRFNEAQTAAREWQCEIAPGVTVGERLSPIDRAALFVPSGKASYPSVVLHLGVPAVVAGVESIVIIVPPVPGGRGEVDPAVLFAASELGIRELYRANGPAGIAAAALGTTSLAAARLVVGPGSPAVAAAQILVQAEGVRTNPLLGPSESIILADNSADPELVAADLLNEAEHGPDSACLLVTWSRSLVDTVEPIVARRLAALPDTRRSYASTTLNRHGGVVLCDGVDAAVAFVNEYAPEHMTVDVQHADVVARRIVNAGEILLGPYTPISAANFAVGVPASIPTGGYARAASAVTARTFLKATSIARCSRPALEAMHDCVLALSQHEGFPAHAASYTARFEPPSRSPPSPG